jgi:DNA-binding transcriptional MerR regulator
MVGKVRVQKRLYYKIGEACKALGIQPYVLRYWETEFPALAPSKSRSGQRVYSEKELEIIRRIKELLYEEGYTIAGAKKKLETELSIGMLGGLEAPEVEPGDGAETTLAAEAPVPEPPPPIARRTRLQPAVSEPREPREPVAEAEREMTTEDNPSEERVRKLRAGIAKALDEAREILALLDAKPL